ncbi:methyltransferase domain-containing protein [Arcanobacterium haemolyticum]|nr:methyltransferase domain-containing protein [Arcanobacterium haemolyticum]
MHCSYFDAGICHSCTHMGEPYIQQLDAKDAAVRALLPQMQWLAPCASPEQGFRNKAKLVVGGTASEPTLGILDDHRRGIDLTSCGLYEPPLAATFPTLAAFISRAGLTPFDVRSGHGELKNILVTISPDREFLIRFVLRSTEALVRIKKYLPWLQANIPGAHVVTVNLLPERKAVPEGDTEIVLSDDEILPMRLEDVTLGLRPQSFFQTNTLVARELYAQARAWVDDIVARRRKDSGTLHLWDLYCGVGGFALHCAGAGRDIYGVEISEQAIQSAHASAKAAGIEARFIAGDAFQAVQEAGDPDIVVVNPPRRGIGNLAAWLNESRAHTVVYSSCNPKSLAVDLTHMPDFHPVYGRLFDMFPQTDHAEVMVILERRS